MLAIMHKIPMIKHVKTASSVYLNAVVSSRKSRLYSISFSRGILGTHNPRRVSPELPIVEHAVSVSLGCVYEETL